MPDTNRIVCTRCQESVYNCIVDGERIPIVVRMNAGKPSDTGPELNLNAANVRVPSFIRSLMQTPVARIELCVKCFAEVLGLPLVTAKEDPMYDITSEAAQNVFNRQFADESMPMSERANLVHTRALHALAVGWGEAAATDLPPAFRSKEEADFLLESMKTTDEARAVATRNASPTGP